jgi:uncharacterized protein YllA (UPF0747 family)
MKKIKSIKQLQNEKRRIKLREEELEKKIRGNWNELKESLKPASIVKETFSNAMKHKAENNVNGESVFKNTFTYGMSLLAKKIADKAGIGFNKLFKTTSKD